MKNILVTGSGGFVGQNLLVALQRLDDVVVFTWSHRDERTALEGALVHADIIYHLAGVNRPDDEDDFASGNSGLSREIVRFLQENGRTPAIILPSSVQAELDNPYGRSKKAAEQALLDYNHATGALVAIYRLPGVFGKWSRPNYNTVVATFCHNIARGLDIHISDPDHEIDLVYIDDVVSEFIRHLGEYGTADRHRYTVPRTFRVTLGDLADRIRRLHAIRKSLLIPDLADEFMRCLYATYLSFLPEDAFSSPVKMFTDNRGWLFELIKSKHFGQIFVSKTLPGITRGDHYHDTKLEKFCVIQGRGIIRFRHIHSREILEYPVDGEKISVVDIPPGYTHSIENNGDTEMICLFWANQVFDPENPDTYWEKVIE